MRRVPHLGNFPVHCERLVASSKSLLAVEWSVLSPFAFQRLTGQSHSFQMAGMLYTTDQRKFIFFKFLCVCSIIRGHLEYRETIAHQNVSHHTHLIPLTATYFHSLPVLLKVSQQHGSRQNVGMPVKTNCLLGPGLKFLRTQSLGQIKLRNV